MNDDQFKALKRAITTRHMAEVQHAIPQLDIDQVYELAVHLACGMAGMAAGALAAGQMRAGVAVDHLAAAEKVAEDIGTVVRQGGALRHDAANTNPRGDAGVGGVVSGAARKERLH